MQDTMLTFARLRELDGVISGGTVEINDGQKIIRGCLVGLLYWTNTSLRQISWEQNTIWSVSKKRWYSQGKPDSFRYRAFPYTDLEKFYGPLESELGEFHFMIAKLFVTIYPNGCEVPEHPKERDEITRILVSVVGS